MTTTMIDSATMFRRDLKHALRYPVMTISGIGTAVIFLLLFVGVFGNALGADFLPAGAGRYIDYVAPGVILMAAGTGTAATAIKINQDMLEGFIARLRTMSIARMSVLTGQVIGSLVRTLISGVLVVLVAVALGFRPSATPVEYLAAFGVFAMLTFALTWMAVAFGLATKTVAGANSLTLILQFLPLISSAFLPTDSMPAGVAWFAEHQPYTPIIETLRGLLMGSGIGTSAWWAIGWCVVLAAVGFFWSRALYNRPRGA
ncbi:ABC-2 type transport system permease protein [Asanoa hainanensis]|uniref:Transport permease protein n=1 Tax=Asanoa hainanensis TaxID=560556 RepID=A0A239GKP5_9ACTN|nr:ABC transporter permease [Asanoa hainanensis]SNS69338.1 ABC-2 type transport system permease protein [Asanoa hainanensis]